MNEGAGLVGHLELICDVDARGCTRLRHQSFRAPVHLSKPHHDEGVLVLNVVNPTAGYLEGDRLRNDVRVERGARLLLTMPSASRVHAMRGGRAEVRQHYRVGAGGSLDVWPGLLIPQRAARYRQQTEVDLDPDAELLLFETLASGRVASGEVFAYDELSVATDLRLASRLVARERYRLSPGDGSLDALRRRFSCAYYASAFLFAPALSARSPCWAAILASHGDAVWLGISTLFDHGFVVKMIAADSVNFRRTLLMIRAAVYDALGRSPPNLRRAGDIQ